MKRKNLFSLFLFFVLLTACGATPPQTSEVLAPIQGQATSEVLTTVLKVNKPETLEELRKSSAARFLGETLGPTSIVVKDGALPKVLAALAEMGLLAEDESSD